jgi:DNA repair protein RadC
MTTTAKTEELARYVVRRRRSQAEDKTTTLGAKAARKTKDDAIIARALTILSNRLRKPGAALTSPSAAREYLRLLLADREHEVFVCLFLDGDYRVLKCEELFRGTLTKASVYPREVVKAALAVNAAAVIFAHNHTSSDATPSEADKLITRLLVNALDLIDVKVRDHLIVAGENSLSFAERGLL